MSRIRIFFIRIFVNWIFLSRIIFILIFLNRFFIRIFRSRITILFHPCIIADIIV